MITLLAACAVQSIIAQMPRGLDAGVYEIAGSYDLSIVQLDKHIGIEQRNRILAGGPEIRNGVWIDRLKVLDTTDPHNTGFVKIFLAAKYFDASNVASPIEAGRRYLMFSVRRSDPNWVSFFAVDQVAGSGSLHHPSREYELHDQGYQIERKSNEEIDAMALLPTKATKLAPDDDPGRRVAKSLVECFVGADAYTAAMVCNALFGPRWPGYWTMTEPVPTISDSPMSLALRQVADASPPPIRYRIYHLLNDWQIPGTERPEMQALLACATSSDHFDQPDDRLDLPQYVYIDGYPEVDRQADHGLVDPEQWYQAITHATNVRVRNLLLTTTVPGVLSTERETVVAGFLNQPNPMIQRFIVYHLAANLKDETHIPHSQEVRHGKEVVTEWPDLDEMVTYWRNYYHIPPP